MIAYFDHAEDANPAGSLKTFWFKPERPLYYIAGQYTELSLANNTTDSRGIRRWFTLSSSPTEELLSITTRIVPRPSDFKKSLLQLHRGQPVTLSEPMGDFVLPRDATIPLLFVAAGVGITPVRSIIKWLEQTGESRDIILLYAAHNPSDLAFATLLARAPGVDFRPLVSQPEPGWTGSTGHLKAEDILEISEKRLNSMIYISGPESIVEELEAKLLRSGVSRQRLVLDFYHGYQE